jgi:hypothetical protein
MMKGIPESKLNLLKDETKAYAFLATTMADGTPQVTPVWFSTDDTHILINTRRGRVKDKNMRQRPDVAVLIMDFSDPLTYLQVRGKVVESTEEGANEHTNALSHKYDNQDFRPLEEGEVRVIYKILPN